ncbi:unnamed protein product, partial [Laminaria digitata]
SSSIRLIDLGTGKVARKLSAGHAGAVRVLSFSSDGRYLASSASSARFVNVFDVAGEAAPSEPVSTLSFEATPLYLAFRASFEGGGGEGGGGGGGGTVVGGDELTVVAGFDTGGVSVLRTRRRGDGKEGATSKLNIRGPAGSSSSSSPSALHACLSNENPTCAILLATGSPASPGFEEALYQDSAGALLSISTIGGGLVDEGEGEEAAGTKSLPAHVVGPGELGVRGFEKDLAAGDDGEAGRALKKLKGVGEEAVFAREGGGEESSMSIAERLEALEGTGAVQPRAESLSTVLTQALQSGDESLLEQCLAVGEQGVIEATVERLPSAKVLQFLLRVVAKLEKRPNRAAALGRWIRALLSCHLGYLVSVPGLPDKLALLHQLIDRRVASFPKLLQLSGRLDLLLARAKAEGGGRRGAGGRAMDRPEAVYREEEEEDDDEEEEEEEEEESGEEDEEEEEDGDDSGSEDQQDMDEDDD